MKKDIKRVGKGTEPAIGVGDGEITRGHLVDVDLVASLRLRILELPRHSMRK